MAASNGGASCTLVWPCAHGALIELAGDHDVTTHPEVAGLERAVTARGGEVHLQPGSDPVVTRVLELTGWLPRPGPVPPGDGAADPVPAGRAGR